MESTIHFFKNVIITLFLQRSVLMCLFPQIVVENVQEKQKSIYLFNWEKAFENISTDENDGLLNNPLNIFRNYILNKIVKYIYIDPPWFTKQIKFKLKNR